MAGKIMLQGEINSEEYTIKVADLEPGNYVLQIRQNGRTVSQLLIVK
jgi:hypothetical protein